MKNENELFEYWVNKLDKEAIAALEKAIAEAKAWEAEQKSNNGTNHRDSNKD